MTKTLSITSKTLVTALGAGLADNWRKIESGESGLRPLTLPATVPLSTWVGQVDGLDSVELPSDLADYDCRNNKLAYFTLLQDDFAGAVRRARDHYGASRIGIFIGTSTSGIQQLEDAYFSRADASAPLPEWFNYQKTHNNYSAADFVKSYFQLDGYTVSISTACSSSAKVFASASRAIAMDVCDAALVGGVDTLCQTTLFGFNALQLLSPEPCTPFDAGRKGISIGEAGGFALLERDVGDKQSVRLLGFGESADAYHMSSPHPEGLGAIAAMRAALNGAELESGQIQYVNLHGTGTKANDATECLALQKLFSNVKASSTKAWTGHTLGAAGIVEAIFTTQAIEKSLLPANLNIKNIEPEAKTFIAQENMPMQISYGMTNSFGFGGTNCSLVFGR